MTFNPSGALSCSLMSVTPKLRDGADGLIDNVGVQAGVPASAPSARESLRQRGAEATAPEEWRRCIEFPDYSISSAGRVRRDTAACGTQPGRILRLRLNPKGYVSVELQKQKRARNCFVHRLVALAFIGEPPLSSPFINHKNGIKTDNTPDNLEWVSSSENKAHAVAHGFVALGSRNGNTTHPERRPRGSSHGRARLTESDIPDIFILRRAGWTLSEISRNRALSTTSISKILLGRAWTHVWERGVQ